MNINALLANGRRTDVVGKAVWLDTTTPDIAALWDGPRPGFCGRLYLGHRTNLIDPCAAHVYVDGSRVQLIPVRHLWTPAYQSTSYAIQAPGLSIDLTMKEVKWVHADALCGNLDFYHTGPRPLDVDIQFSGDLAAAAIRRKPLAITTGTGALLAELKTRVYVSLNCPHESISPYATTKLRYACALGLDWPHSQSSYQMGLETTPKIAESEFEAWFSSHVPELSTSDLGLLRLYYYRWFVVFRSLHRPSRSYPGHPMAGTVIYESPVGSWFSAPVGLPLPLQIRELRWMIGPEGVADTLRAWCANAGALRMYASDPITPALSYDLHHPGELDLQRLYECAVDYLENPASRSPRLAGGGLASFPTTIGSWVTGTEFAPDFFAHTREPWDHSVNESTIPPPGLPAPGGRDSPAQSRLAHLLRVDTNTWHLTMLMSAAQLAQQTGRKASDILRLQRAAERLRRKLAEIHCDEQGIFRSVDARTGKRITEVLNFEAAMPFLLGSWEEKHRRALAQILSEGHLLAPFGITSTSQQCPAFCSDNRWQVGPHASRDQPYAYPCCWNGPAWNFANSWVLLALGEAVEVSGDADLRETFQVIWDRWSDAHFLRGDPSLPLVMEHYQPFTGEPFNAIPDYFHSAWLDVFFRYIVGLSDSAGWLEVHPLSPIGGELTLRNIPWRGRQLDLHLAPRERRSTCRVSVDGRPIADLRGDPPWQIEHEP